MKKTILTICIVAYKNYKKVENAIDSINYYCPNISKQIIVVDNSDYNSRELNQELNQQIQRIKSKKDVTLLSLHKNVGFGKANNIALAKAKGMYFGIVNPDIILIEDSFSKIINFLDSNSKIGAVIPKLINEHGKILPVYRRNITPYDIFIRYINPYHIFDKRKEYHTMQDKDYSKIFNVPFGQGSFLVVRTSIMSQLNGFDDRFFMYLEDADLCKRINQISSLVYFPNTQVIHLWAKASHRNKKLFFIHLSSMVKYFAKWGLN